MTNVPTILIGTPQSQTINFGDPVVPSFTPAAGAYWNVTVALHWGNAADKAILTDGTTSVPVLAPPSGAGPSGDISLTQVIIPAGFYFDATSWIGGATVLKFVGIELKNS